MLRTRVHDGSIVRLIGTWLHAGVREEGVLTHPETGVPQGGVIAPVLAHVVLHHVLDAWCEHEVRPRMQGRCVLMRCADAFVMGGEREADARKSMAVLPKRCARGGRCMHPTKPTVRAFRKPEAHTATEHGNGTCDLLGLTHDWTTSRQGRWVITRTTARKRLRRTTQSLWQGCRTNRHAPLQDQYRMRCVKLRGHVQYDGMRGNVRMVEGIAHDAAKAWRYWLSRRSSTSGSGWEKFQKLLRASPLPIPRIVHNI